MAYVPNKYDTLSPDFLTPTNLHIVFCCIFVLFVLDEEFI